MRMLITIIQYRALTSGDLGVLRQSLGFGVSKRCRAYAVAGMRASMDVSS